ncbi:hypothetical protein PR048_023189 [Dryococelus australis]|uniref:Uncharacterized protein n=1 Tax=Dryococelus australis TaxID=614101 RepID=A0ABQ9GTG8_9NEOP|nr:hypothetical protein PR048_023189 [Dryococelus australis]
MVFDTSWRRLAQSSPSAVAADNQCTVDIGKFVHKTVDYRTTTVAVIGPRCLLPLRNFSAEHVAEESGACTERPCSKPAAYSKTRLPSRSAVTSRNRKRALSLPIGAASSVGFVTGQRNIRAAEVLLNDSAGVAFGRACQAAKFSLSCPSPPPSPPRLNPPRTTSHLCHVDNDDQSSLFGPGQDAECCEIFIIFPSSLSFAHSGDAALDSRASVALSVRSLLCHVASVVRLLASHLGVPDFGMWESCRTMPLVDGFSRGSPVSPALSIRCCSILTPRFTLIGSRLLDVNRLLKGRHRSGFPPHVYSCATHVTKTGGQERAQNSEAGRGEKPAFPPQARDNLMRQQHGDSLFENHLGH